MKIDVSITDVLRIHDGLGAVLKVPVRLVVELMKAAQQIERDKRVDATIEEDAKP